MKTMLYVMGGVMLCVALALLGLFLPYAHISYLTVAVSCTVGLLCIGGILRYILHGSV